ncbi:unnamed protein product [Didymodactylos carnosus]|uniref:Uncharacterized protein n=1 Tax=Didymodactylos carnosus TaxID=1234261 RepID=A0A814Y1S8_9BILA|nr:unnamed protein product [Didymodactylos carnosus]CAF1224023.1 unnamed protein product [Didymodactylos carnosus]CAF3840496.1 unnamed protein product [Didymodactylos carnosus]CAF3987161.1 unnamed protein product [Didymodactylos carnosus]
MNGGQLPPNCVVMSLNLNGGMQQQYGQFQQQPYYMQYPSAVNAGNFMFPQPQQPMMMPQQQMNFSPFSQVPPFMYDRDVSRGFGLYPPSDANYSQYPHYIGYSGPAQQINYPVAPYQEQQQHYDTPTYRGRKSRRQSHHRERDRAPHANTYEEDSFDSEMRNLDWDGLFNRHGQKPAAIGYRRSNTRSPSSSTSPSSSSNSSITSDETIRRVSISKTRPTDVYGKQQEKYQHHRQHRQYDRDYSHYPGHLQKTNNTHRSNNRNGTSVHKKHRKNDLMPFEYSSEFIPMDKEKQSKNQTKVNTTKKDRVSEDDVFIINNNNDQQQQQKQKTPPAQSEQQKT